MLLAGTVSDLTNAISTLGFPIVMCAGLWWYIQKDCAANRKELSNVAEALNNNTLAITKLLERLDKEHE